MVKVTFVDTKKESRMVDADIGQSLMEAALSADVQGIDAECGGGCSCATCHVRLSPEWLAKLGSASGMELEMLEFADGYAEGSRLSCQIPVTEALDGIVLEVVERL